MTVLKGILGGMVMGWAAAALFTAPRLDLDVYPHVCSHPCTIRVRVRVDPNADNRELDLEVSGDHYTSISQVPLDGDKAPKTQPFFWYRDLPAGTYEVAATLQTASGQMFARATTVQAP